MLIYSLPREVCIWWVCLGEICIQGDLHLGGLPRGNLHLGGLHRGDWADPPNRILQDTVNEREVRILLECILV